MPKPQGSRSKDENQGMEPDEAVPITCVARTVECVLKNGNTNFQIVTLTICDGIVMKRENSEPWSSWETIAKLEVMNHVSTLNLNSGYEHGKAWSK